MAVWPIPVRIRWVYGVEPEPRIGIGIGIDAAMVRLGGIEIDAMVCLYM